MGALKVYDLTEYSIILAGIPITGGYAEDEALTLEYQEEMFRMQVGADGQVTRYKTSNKSAKGVLKLAATSEMNAVLSALHNLDINVPGGAGVGPLLVKDRQGTSLFTAAKSWIERMPNVGLGKTPGPREWPIGIADLTMLVGGN